MSDSDEPNRSIRVGIIGFGFMGRTHAKSYQDAARDGYNCTLLAIADSNLNDLSSASSSGNISTDGDMVDTNCIEFYQDSNAIINHPEIDLISICTHTDTHVDLAIAALNAGKHVLIEKPIAIHSSDVQRLATHADTSDLLCIPAMCMRHWPAWMQIHEIINSKQYGKLRSASFQRLGTRPGWSAEFYSDQSRSGGVLHDLHIHDTDFIVHCFGKPESVTTTGDHLHLTTLYHYPNIPHVVAQGAWDHQPSLGYQMKCTIVFELATLDFDFNRDSQLILHQGEQSIPVKTSQLTGYDGEIRWVLDQIKGATQSTQPIQDALAVTKVLEAEAQSLETKRKVQLS